MIQTLDKESVKIEFGGSVVIPKPKRRRAKDGGIAGVQAQDDFQRQYREDDIHMCKGK